MTTAEGAMADLSLNDRKADAMEKSELTCAQRARGEEHGVYNIEL